MDVDAASRASRARPGWSLRMTYSNPQSSKLGLLDDDIKMEGKLLRLCADLERKILTPIPGMAWQWHVQRADVTAAEALAAMADRPLPSSARAPRRAAGWWR